MQLELGQDVAEVWKVLFLNQRSTSSSNSAIFEKNPCIIHLYYIVTGISSHLLLASREVVKNKQMPVCISIRTPHSRDFEHHWKICHHMHALLRWDMMWLSGASAISDKQNEESWSVPRKQKQGQPRSIWISKVLLKIWCGPFYEQWDSPRSETQDFRDMVGKHLLESISLMLLWKLSFQLQMFVILVLPSYSSFPKWNGSGAWQTVWKIRDFFVFCS